MNNWMPCYSNLKNNDKICHKNFKENGGYTFNESHRYFGHPDYENSNTDQGDKSVEENNPTNKEDLSNQSIECYADDTGVVCEMDEYDSDAGD